jgi:hypothetical protein
VYFLPVKQGKIRPWDGPMFTAEILKRHIHHWSYSQRRWHLDENYVRVADVRYRGSLAGFKPGSGEKMRQS